MFVTRPFWHHFNHSWLHTLHYLLVYVAFTLSLFMSGNVSLCPSSVVQYAKQDNEILTQMDNSCYTVVPHRYSWSHAESECNNRGGHLFHVQDSNENLAIYILLNTHFNHAVWMGLSDLNQEEHFQWTSSKYIVSFCFVLLAPF